MPGTHPGLWLGSYTYYPDPRLATFLDGDSNAWDAAQSARPLDDVPAPRKWEHLQEGVALLKGAHAWTGASALEFVGELAKIGLQVTISGDRAEVRVDAHLDDGPGSDFERLAPSSPLRDRNPRFVVLALAGPPRLVGPEEIPVHRATIFGSMGGFYLGSTDERCTRLWRDVHLAELAFEGQTYLLARRTFRRIRFTLLEDIERLGREVRRMAPRRRDSKEPEHGPVALPEGREPGPASPGSWPSPEWRVPAAAGGVDEARNADDRVSDLRLGPFVRYREPRLGAFLSGNIAGIMMARFSGATVRHGACWTRLTDTDKQQLLQGHRPWTSSAPLDAFVQNLRRNGLEVAIEKEVATVALAGDVDYGSGSSCEKLVQAAGFDAPHPRFLVLDIKGPPRLHGPRNIPIHEVDLVGEIYCDLYRRAEDEYGSRLWKGVYVAEFRSPGRSYLFARSTFRRICSLVRRHEYGLRAAVERSEIERTRAAVVPPEPPDDLPVEEEHVIASAFFGGGEA